jgi:acyl transferase domain-containing protein
MSNPPRPAGDQSPEKQALLALRRMRARLEDVERARTEPVAIVGVGCRFPGNATSPEAYWRLLSEGVDAVAEVPRDRWDIDAYYDPDPDAPGKMYTRYGAFVPDIDRFDAPFFRIAPREAISMDPQQRLLLEVTWEALENAGCAPDGLMGTDAGVFVGISTNDYAQMLLKAAEDTGVDTYFGTGNAFNASAGRLSYVLGLQGPAMAVDTACSSSLVAIHLACQSLRNRECGMAIAGGVNLILTPGVTVNFCRARMLAADGRCRTFDAAADGYTRGEGCGVVVLKLLSEAVSAGDRILALIRGSAVNQDGRSAGFTAPNELAQQAVIHRALAAARLSPADISYVEAHGTGTSLGDPIEMHALAAAFAGRTAERPLVVGSVKTNMGHLEAAAGVAGIIKVALALQHRVIPPHLHFNSLNPHIALDGFPLVVPTRPMAWTSDEGPRRAGISSFGFSGTNAHVVLEEAPAQAERDSAGSDRPAHVLTLSARTDAAVRALAARYSDFLKTTDAPAADVCFTANAGRSLLEERLAVVGRSNAELSAALQGVARDGRAPGVHRGRAAPADVEVAFLFTGQGAQYPGMGRELYDSQPTFRRTIDRCDELLRRELERPLLSVMYPSPGASGPLDDTAYTQPALFAIEYALAELWRSWGVEPAAVLGHSVGEYVAACVAGVFSLEDGLKLVAARGRLMQQLPRGGAMAAVFAGAARVEAALARNRGAAVAAMNGPEETVISGDAAAVNAAVTLLAEAGVRSRKLAVSHAFHSALIDPMLDEFERIAGAVRTAPPRTTFVSNLTGGIVDQAFRLDGAYWRRHARQPVRFADGIRALHQEGTRVFLEVGPSPALLALARRAVPEDGCTWVASLRNGRSDFDSILDGAAALFARGVRIDWKGFDRDYSRCRISLPTYPFERERYWVDLPETQPARGGHGRGPREPVPGTYEPVWRAGEPTDRADAPAAGIWVIVGDGRSIAGGVDARLRGLGFDTIVVPPSTSFERTWREHVVPVASRIAGILHLAALEAATLDAGDPVEAQRALCGSLGEVARAIQDTPQLRPRLWVVTRGSQAVAADERINVAQAPTWGFAGGVASELPHLQPVRLDVSAEDGDEAAIDAVCRELCTSGRFEDRVAYRHGVRHVLRLVAHAPFADVPAALGADGCYMVTGGLGALGLHVARWLVDRGARQLVLVGRHAGGPAARGVVTACEAKGARVRIVQADVTDAADVERLFTEAEREFGRVRGVVHAAGVLDDALLEHQGWDRVARVLAPKVAGAWHLHRRTLGHPLEFFVLFSSAAALLGAGGQANYAAANAFLDSLAHERRRQGLAGLSINWGPWADAGMATGAGAVHQRRWEESGVRPIDPPAGLRVLGALLGTGKPQVAVLDADWSALLRAAGDVAMPLLDELATAPARIRAARGVARADLLTAAGETRERLAEDVCRDVLTAALGLREPVRVDCPVGDLGLDSLMALEARNRIMRGVGVSIPVVKFLEGRSVRDLARLVLDDVAREIESTAGATPAIDAMGADEAQALLGRLTELTDAEVDDWLATLAPEHRPV